MRLVGDAGTFVLVGDAGTFTLIGAEGFQPANVDELLLESGEWLLLEDGSRILLEV